MLVIQTFGCIVATPPEDPREHLDVPVRVMDCSEIETVTLSGFPILQSPLTSVDTESQLGVRTCPEELTSTDPLISPHLICAEDVTFKFPETIPSILASAEELTIPP